MQRPTASESAFRADIQGLRAIAVVLVLAYHLWPGSVTGGYVGVDVFFVISGFLITGHLLQHQPRTGRDLLEFWGRRIRRLLPAAFLVLIATAVASRLLAPETQWAAIARETIASALYVQNWVLASNSVNYLSAEEPPTPLQHYWSLSVEEQFYLFWPILILAIGWLATRSRVRPVGLARLAMLAVVGGSLFLSVTWTAEEPASAYFITPPRVWELAVGGVLATLAPLSGRRLARRTVDGLAWAGIAMIVVAAVLYTPETPFPGAAALLPVIGTALVILAAADGSRSPTRVLRLRPTQHLGDTSYSIYLWHWPLILLWPYAFGTVDLLDALAIAGLTIGLATITKVHVEDAYRFSPRFQPLRPTFRFAIVGMLVVSTLGTGQLLEAQLRVDAAVAEAAALEEPGPPEPGDGTDAPEETGGTTPDPAGTIGPDATDGLPEPSATGGPASCTGAAAIVRGFEACPQDPAGRMVPGPVAARSDQADAYADGCWNYAPFGTRITCRYGKGDVRVALVGNSHAGQWLPALQVLAKRNGWTITTFLASQCNATDAELEFFSSSKTEGCLDYGRWVLKATGGDAFDLVITSQRQSVRARGATWPETVAPALAGYSTYLRRWSESGANVLILHDTPWPGRALPGTVPDCLALHRDDQPACAGTPESWAWMDPLYDAAVAAPLPGISTLEVQRYFCTPAACPAVIGSVVVYWDGSHMTATYAKSIAPFVEAEILAALDRATPSP